MLCLQDSRAAADHIHHEVLRSQKSNESRDQHFENDGIRQGGSGILQSEKFREIQLEDDRHFHQNQRTPESQEQHDARVTTQFDRFHELRP